MNIILLSGGSGKRLWPLSNNIRSKQFVRVLRKTDFRDIEITEDSCYESMVQRVYRQIKDVDNHADVTIATSKAQVSSIRNQLGEDVGISVEPCRRDTFAAIALATAYLHDVKCIDSEDAVIVCPVDPYVENEYFDCLKKLHDAALNGSHNLMLMGIKPTYPSEKYGYICPQTSDGGIVYSFKEKPDEMMAKKYIEEGALWNGGVFGYKLSYVLDKAREILGSSEYDTLIKNYSSFRKISFDYAVVEEEKSIGVIVYKGEWKDLGTWNTLTEAMDDPIIGEAVLNESCDNVHVINELGIPILGMGLRDMVIAASSEGILVSDKEQSSYIKPLVEKIDQPVKYAEKSWGSYRVIDVRDESMTVVVTLNPGHGMNYHSHDKRDEIWNIVRGGGRTIVDGMEQYVKPGDVITMAAGCKHTIVADNEGLQLIEIQLGEEIAVSDKRKHELPTGLVGGL